MSLRPMHTRSALRTSRRRTTRAEVGNIDGRDVTLQAACAIDCLMNDQHDPAPGHTNALAHELRRLSRRAKHVR